MRSRQKVLNATLRLIEDGGFEGVNVAAVASAAGVSRQTVYSIFGSREEVVSQAVASLVLEILGGIRVRLESAGSVAEFATEMIVSGRGAFRSNPVLAALLVAEQGNPVFDYGMIARAKPVAKQFFVSLVDRGMVDEHYLDEIVEITVRLGLSVIVFDSDAVRTDELLREFLGKWLEPALERLT